MAARAHNALLTQRRISSNAPVAMRSSIIILVAALATLSACGDSSKQQAASSSPPVKKSCTTPEQAGMKAADLTRKLVELRTQGTISAEEYSSLNGMMSNAFRAWAEQQDLKAYCAKLDRVSKSAGLD